MPPRSHALVSPASSLCLAVAVVTAAAMNMISLAAAPNYDESAVRSYTLPDMLAGPDGKAVSTAEAWRTTARPHQLDLLERTVYGRRLPTVPVRAVRDVDRATVTLADGGAAIRLQATLALGAEDDAPTTDVLVYLPMSPDRVPVFLNLNFRGNHAEQPDPAIRISQAWMPEDQAAGVVEHRATAAGRGTTAHRWPVAQLVARGYGMATAYCGDVFPDRADGRAASILPRLGRPVAGDLPPDEPGAIAAWAWQLSRILDWLVTLPEVDPERVIVVGHSRLGKTALWAGACDERFAMLVSNESGCGGAALSRRDYGETIDVITTRFPHWFCPAFATYAGRETDLPTDQHALLALAAPRPLVVASAVEDRWADPRGEFLSAAAASPAWKLFGLTGLDAREPPPTDTPVGDRVVYYARTGRHDLLAYDWHRFADVADRVLRGRSPPAVDGYPAFHPLQKPLPVPAPPGAEVLVPARLEDAGQLSKLVSMAGGPIDWTIDDGALVVHRSEKHANHIVSTVLFRDADIHAEFMTSPEAKGNSGLYLHGHYEMQIYDSFGVEPPTDQDEGSLYRFSKPLLNASLPTGQWQVYDVRFIAPRRDASGKVVRPGSVTAWLNGRLVQDALPFTEPRSPYVPYKYGVTDYLRSVEKTLLSTGEGPLFLQDHGSPTRFRNVWIKQLDQP